MSAKYRPWAWRAYRYEMWSHGIYEIGRDLLPEARRCAWFKRQHAGRP